MSLNNQNQPLARALLLLAAGLSLAGAAQAQERPEQEQPEQIEIEPDRPDVTNGTRIVPIGVVQIEFGGLYLRNTSDQHSANSPFTVRVGITDWLEARVGADGLLTNETGDLRTTGFGNVQLGAKLRLWADPGGAPVLSILPGVTLPTADANRGLGSGDVDTYIAALTGTDIGHRGHIDINYGIGSIGAGQGGGHFAQHLASASLSAAVTSRWNPYVEVFWFSKTEADGSPETSMDTGLIYELRSHFALDGGVQFGVAGASPGFAAFGGVSILVGAERALNGRQRKLSGARGKASAAPPSSTVRAGREASTASPTQVHR
jgi:hypothetical protein